MNKVLIKLYIPYIEKQYDVLIPLNKRINNIIKLFVKAINELNRGMYEPEHLPCLYDKVTAIQYNFNDLVKDTNIRNGSELILV